jgi:predicted nucleic acid-binding protein
LILYVDTSALLKAYVEEEGSPLIRDQLGQADRLTTSAITYVEVHTALARRRHGGDLPPAEYRKAMRSFEEDWERFLRLDVGDAVLREAARLGTEHVLRAYDAIHLGSAVLLRSQLGTDIMLASWDVELDAAAARERFSVLRARRR